MYGFLEVSQGGIYFLSRAHAVDFDEGFVSTVVLQTKIVSLGPMVPSDQ